MLLTVITQDVLMQELAMFIEITISIEEIISIEMTEEFLYATMRAEELITVEAMPRYQKILQEEETQR